MIFTVNKQFLLNYRQSLEKFNIVAFILFVIKLLIGDMLCSHIVCGAWSVKQYSVCPSICVLSKCEQCHVDSRGVRLNTDLFFHRPLSFGVTSCCNIEFVLNSNRCGRVLFS